MLLIGYYNRCWYIFCCVLYILPKIDETGIIDNKREKKNDCKFKGKSCSRTSLGFHCGKYLKESQKAQKGWLKSTKADKNHNGIRRVFFCVVFCVRFSVLTLKQ